MCGDHNLSLMCFETVASWQHCIDYNATKPGLSKLRATPAALVSGGQTSSLIKQGKRRNSSKVTSANHIRPSGSPQTTRLLASSGKGDPSPDARLKRTGRFRLLKATSSKERHKHIHAFSFGPKSPPLHALRKDNATRIIMRF